MPKHTALFAQVLVSPVFVKNCGLEELVSTKNCSPERLNGLRGAAPLGVLNRPLLTSIFKFSRSVLLSRGIFYFCCATFFSLVAMKL